MSTKTRKLYEMKELKKNNSDLHELVSPVNREHKISVRLSVLGINRKELADGVGMSPQNLGDLIRSDHRNVRKKTLIKISNMLGVTLEYLKDMDGWEGLFDDPPEWMAGN